MTYPRLVIWAAALMAAAGCGNTKPAPDLRTSLALDKEEHPAEESFALKENGFLWVLRTRVSLVSMDEKRAIVQLTGAIQGRRRIDFRPTAMDKPRNETVTLVYHLFFDKNNMIRIPEIGEGQDCDVLMGSAINHCQESVDMHLSKYGKVSPE